MEVISAGKNHLPLILNQNQNQVLNHLQWIDLNQKLKSISL